MIPPNEIHILLPAYNESNQIKAVINGLRKKGFENILVINDGSKDDTATLARQMNVMVISHYINRGAGAAVQTGLTLAKKKGWQMLVLMDADGQHDPDDIFVLKQKMDETKSDLVIGSRFIAVNGSMPKSRIFFNGIANVMTNLFCKKHYTDSQSGLRLLNKKAIEKIDLQINGFGFCSEMLFKAEQQKLKIEETPTKVIYTDYSLSKGQDFQIGITTAFNFLWNILFR